LKGEQLLLGEALQSHPQLALEVNASAQVLPHLGVGWKRLAALYARENGIGRPETGNSMSAMPHNLSG
jgi:hypothetical protein